jgi:2-methylcitrate dehydratase PrpD
MYPDVVAMRVRATANTGHVIEFLSRDPLGHTNKPMKDEDVRVKFSDNCEPVLGAEQSAAILDAWWKISSLSAAQLTAALDLLDRKT